MELEEAEEDRKRTAPDGRAGGMTVRQARRVLEVAACDPTSENAPYEGIPELAEFVKGPPVRSPGTAQGVASRLVAPDAVHIHEGEKKAT
jgi:hypothetical protein